MQPAGTLTYHLLTNVTETDIAQINELIINTWDYRDWIPKENVLPMAEFMLDEVILTSSHIIVVRDGETIAGIIAATAAQDLMQKVSANTRQYIALRNILAHERTEPGLFELYLETLIINGEMIAQCGQTFDSSLNLFMIDERYQGRGIGNQLWQRSMNYLTASGASHYFLWTDSDSDFGFYEHKGLQRLTEQVYDWGGRDVSETYYVYAGQCAYG